MHRRAITLIELLVVLVFLALLIAFLIPSTSGSHGPSKRTICGTNLKGQVNAFATYALGFGGHCQSSTATLTSLCDQTTEMRDALLGPVPPAARTSQQRWFYCPENSAQNPAKLWTHAGISTWGYVWLNDRGTAGAALPSTFPPRKAPLSYLSTVGGPNAATTILASDLVVTDTATPPLNYTPKHASVNFGSNHVWKNTITGVNILFADGHISWTPFNPTDATPVQQPRGDFFWFPNP
jgi:prepilin-type processing-associated H-X9-DG protein